MRNLKIVDAVIQLHDIARLIRDEVGGEPGSDELAKQVADCADKLHEYSILDDKANSIVYNLIDEVKKK